MTDLTLPPPPALPGLLGQPTPGAMTWSPVGPPPLGPPPGPGPGPGPAVSIRALTKRYGLTLAVDSLDLDIPKGSIYGIIGPNGAGKTTTLSVVATLLRPTSGQVLVFGHNPATHARDVRRVLGYMPDVMGVHDRLTVDEYLRFFAHAHRVPEAKWDSLIAGLLELVNLGEKRNELVDGLSRGMKQRLSLARALVHDPELLVLDEPASGLDPQARVELRGLLQELQSLGKTVVVSSHILAELQELCTDVAVIARGRVVSSGPMTTIMRSRDGGGIRVRVRLADGQFREDVVPDVEAQRAYLHDLVAVQQLPVVEFATVNTGLEDVFLDAINERGPQWGP
jgi:ABC-type multidrug transport system ATPase subunit